MGVRDEIKQYFDIQELVCKHVYEKFKDEAWQFLDDALLENLLWLRTTLNVPIYVNNWQVGGTRTQRGLRCNVCDLVRKKALASKVYMSAHAQGKAVDMTVGSMQASEVRQWLQEHADEVPHAFRLEDGVTWVHMDVRPTDSTKKCTLFRA